MKLKWNSILVLATLIAALSPGTLSAQKQNDAQLLRVRETVWRAWFAGDTRTLEELVPLGTIVMSGGEEKWKNQADVLRTAVEFHAKGGKLVRLEFPRTEVQHFGDVAIVWSSYVVELEVDGKRSSSSGRVTEIFVWQHGRWTNPGWHTDEPPTTESVQKQAPMTQHASGPFDVKLVPQKPDSDVAQAANLGRMSIDKQFHGDLEATSKGEMVAAQTDVKGSAGYVAMERVTGALKGRKGSFVLQHSATMNRGVPELSITVVPDSGTDELKGLAGKMNIIIADGKHSYEFDYTLTDKP